MSGIRAKQRAINKAIKAHAGATCVPKITVVKGGGRACSTCGAKAVTAKGHHAVRAHRAPAGRQVMTPAQRHMELVARAGCVIGNRGKGECQGRVTVHHVAEGSGKRSDFATVGLCEEHHQGGTGLHGLSPKTFCRIYRPPGETEWGLLAWVNEDIAKLRLRAPVEEDFHTRPG